MKPSLRKSINAFCRYCIYDAKSGSGTWREQVEACTAQDCPLWRVRPMPDRRHRAAFSAADAG